MEPTKVSINGWMDKQNVVYPCKGYYLFIKRNNVIIKATLWMYLEKKVDEPWKHYAAWETPAIVRSDLMGKWFLSGLFILT